MLASLTDAPFHRPGWVYEEKYDGIRVLTEKDGVGVRLLSRNLRDRTADFPDIVAAIAALPAPTLVLDGEVVVFEASRVSRFQLLQRREDGGGTPVYALFDCLFARGQDLRGRPLTERRRVLEAEVSEKPPLQLSRRLADDGLKAFETARRLGLEGLVAKRLASLYRPSTRSPDWLKVKVRNEDEFVIGGFTRPEGSRQHFGALLVGAWEQGTLRYAGKVGTGFTAQTLTDLMKQFGPLVRRASPFHDLPRERNVTWLEPRLVAQVAYTELTDDGRLRHPVFLGLRDDKAASKVRWPRAIKVPQGGA
ncbi:MAG: non-homologous end-joining DNA ligase [Candidatus Rokuibacteriota bacterium]